MKSSLVKRWPLIVVALLATHVSLMMWAVTKCRSSEIGVIPNYYDQAVRYDEFKADQARLAAALAAPTTRPHSVQP